MQLFFFFFKQKTAYEMRISDWSSDVCSSDLVAPIAALDPAAGRDHQDVARLGAIERAVNPQIVEHRHHYRIGGPGHSHVRRDGLDRGRQDRKSTRLNSSH